ncbi:YjcZ family sporulation protein [Neobacillus niacini]|nr:YjcZ family sporulation protein [Neobacillus niacini]MEC1522592.1 YjcZ family sporulation protein [Neobacillus niacini]
MSGAVGGYAGGGFALLIVLFILLVIIGSSFCGYGY